MEKIPKTLRKCLELLKEQFMANILFKATVDTMITHPATMTHAEVPKEDREQL
jgi:cystathionine beta-lyase/cystathionine gamma-synthase